MAGHSLDVDLEKKTRGSREGEGAEVGSRVERGSGVRVEGRDTKGGRVEGRERTEREDLGTTQEREAGSRVERGKGGRVEGREREGRIAALSASNWFCVGSREGVEEVLRLCGRHKIIMMLDPARASAYGS
eukprot:158558-Rhodomonas_salina.1